MQVCVRTFVKTMNKDLTTQNERGVLADGVLAVDKHRVQLTIFVCVLDAVCAVCVCCLCVLAHSHILLAIQSHTVCQTLTCCLP